MTGRTSRRLAFGALFLLGLGLRAWGYARPPLWLDEYGTAWVVRDGWGDALVRAWERQGQSPLAYLPLKLGGDLFGASPAGLRAASLLWGILCLPAAWLLGRAALGGRTGGLVLLALVACDPPLIQHAQEARPYALSELSLLLSCAACARLARRESWRWRVLYAVSSAAAFSAHPLVALPLVVQPLWLVGCARARQRGRWGRWLASWGAAAVLALPALLHLLGLFGRRAGLDWLKDDYGPLDLAAEHLFPVPLLATAALLGLGVWRRRLRWLRRPAAPGLAPAWVGGTWALLFAVPPLLGVRLACPRYASGAGPGLLLLLGRVLRVRAAGPGWRLAPACLHAGLVALVVLAPNLAGRGTAVVHPHQPWDQVARELAGSWREGELILYASGFIEGDLFAGPDVTPPLRDYATWPLRANLPRDPGADLWVLPTSNREELRDYSRRILEETDRRQAIWLVGMGDLGRVAGILQRRQPAWAVARAEQRGVLTLILLRRRAH